MSKVIGLYRFKNSDLNGNIKYVYSYVTKDEKGILNFNFTDDEEVIKKVFVKYALDNKKTKKDLDNIIDYKHFDLNCESYSDVFDKIAAVEKDQVIDINKFMTSLRAFLNNKELKYENTNLGSEENSKIENNTMPNLTNVFSRVKPSFFKDLDIKIKDKWNSVNPKKKIKFLRTVIVASVVGISTSVGFALTKKDTPVAGSAKFVAIQNDGLNKVKDFDFQKKDEQKVEEVAKNDEGNINTNVKPASTKKRVNYNYGTKAVEKNIVDESLPAYQDPNITIDTNNIDTTTPPVQNKDPYINLYEEEVKPNENNVDQVIDVYPNDDMGDKLIIEEVDISDVNTNNSQPEDNLIIEDVEIDDEMITNNNLTIDDIKLDDKFIDNKDAISSDITVEDEVITDLLPDPNETAKLSEDDYVTTDTDLTNNDTVPVIQETSVITDSSIKAIDAAIAAMEKGEVVDLVYDDTTNTVSYQSIEEDNANSLIK